LSRACIAGESFRTFEWIWNCGIWLFLGCSRLNG
jgi:hypothetical protein